MSEHINEIENGIEGEDVNIFPEIVPASNVTYKDQRSVADLSMYFP